MPAATVLRSCLHLTRALARSWRRTSLALIVLPLTAIPQLLTAQLPAGIPPDPSDAPDLATLAAWIERWLPVVGAGSYPLIDSTGDFFAHASDSVTAAALEGCTLVLHERSVRMVRGETLERRFAIRVPLGQLDTDLVWPKIRQSRVLLTHPNILLTGAFVVPLRNRTRTKFITIASEEESPGDSLAVEHLVPIVYEYLPATRSALALRRAAGHCGSGTSERQ